MSLHIYVKNSAREPIPRLPFQKIAECALGRSYELGIVFVTPKISKEINNRYRQKNNSTNILSFPFSKSEGEVLIDIKTVKREAEAAGEKAADYLKYIFIHGLTHLKGFDHGSRMEAEERKIRAKFR